VRNNPLDFMDVLGLVDCPPDQYDTCVDVVDVPPLPIAIIPIPLPPPILPIFGSGGGSANNCVRPNFAQRRIIKGLTVAANWTNKTIGFGVGASYGLGFGQGFGFAGTGSAQIQVSPGGSASLVYTWGGSGLTQDWLTFSSFGASFILGPQVSVSSGPPSPGPGADVAVSGVIPLRGPVGPGASLDVNGSPDGVTGTLTGGGGAGIASGSVVVTQTAVVPFCTGG